MAIRYTTTEDVKRRLGITVADHDAEVDLAIEAAADWLDRYVGNTDDTGTIVPDPAPPSGLSLACLFLAVRWYKRPDAPFGVAGVGDTEADVAALQTLDPDMGGMVMGLRQKWGIA